MIQKNKLYLTIVLAIFTLTSSYLGLASDIPYALENSNWLLQAIAQDWVNAIIIAPGLLLSAYFAYKKSLLGYIVWLGILIAHLYTFFLYSFSIHFSAAFPVYTAITGLSFYIFIFSYDNKYLSKIKQAVHGNRVNTFLAMFLIIISLLFLMLWSGEIFSAIKDGVIPSSAREAGLITNPVHILDVSLFLPALFMAGFALLKKKTWGYFFAPVILISSTIMSINILSISITFFMKGYSSDLENIPIFLLILLIQLVLFYLYTKPLSPNKRD